MTHKSPVSKSHYISGTQCHLRLWYDSYARELAATPDDALQAFVDTLSACLGWTFLVATNAVALGAGTACFVGVVFGYVPAYQAARLDTIAVLRGN